MNIIIMGKPGSGKGTQAELLSQNGFTIVSTGNLIRQEIESKTPFGLQIKQAMDDGYYLDDDNVFRLLGPTLHREGKFVFDGFPRTVVQAERLDNEKHINIVFELVVSNEEIIKRISNRWMINVDGVQHSFMSKSEAEEFQSAHGGKLFQRPEDAADVVGTRLSVFTEKTAPVIEYYKKQGKVISLDASATIEDVQSEIRKYLLAQGE